MKTKIRNVVSIWVMGLLLLACSKGNEDLPITYEDEAAVPIEKAVEMGSISLNPIFKDVIKVTTGKPPTLEEVLDIMIVLIVDEFGTTVLSSNYRDLSQFIELPVGSYQLFMSNYDIFFAGTPRFESPTHGSDVLSFSVSEGINTTLDFSLQLLDVAVTINISAEIQTIYPDITIDVIDDNPFIIDQLTWNVTENGRIGYFNAVSPESIGIIGVVPDNINLRLTINATNTSGLPVNAVHTYTNVARNEHYVISIESAGTNSISLNITLDDEVVINEIIFL